MIYVSAVWGDAAHTLIIAVGENGITYYIPVDPSNVDYQNFEKQGIPIGPYVDPFALRS
jgi:hypothetical protein